MEPLVTQSPSSSFSHISPLGGAIALINSSDHPNKDSNPLAFRIAWYTIRLFRSSCPIDLAPQDQAIIIKNLALIHQSATHTFLDSRLKLLMGDASAGQVPEKYNVFADIDHILTICERKELEPQSLVMSTVQQQLLDDARGASSTSYYSACAYLFLDFEYKQKSKKASFGLRVEQTEPFREPSNIFRSLVTLKVATDTNSLIKKLNEISADLIGYEFGEQHDEGLCRSSQGGDLLTYIVLRHLVTLNCIICSKKSELITKIPKQRVVLFVKHSISQLHKGKLPKQITSEVLKALSALIVPIKDVYDSFWQQMIDFINNTLSSPNRFLDDDNIPMLHATLELFTSLKILTAEGSNEDLEDAWTEEEGSLVNKLIDLLKGCQGACTSADFLYYCPAFTFHTGISDENHVPRQKVNCLLAHLLEDFSHKPTGDLAELYAVLASESSALQLSAYHILHYQIPNAQGQISLDKALEKDFYAKLPDELLSLIVVAPSPSMFNGADLAIYMPHALRSYLLSWKLTFDHWTNSSDKTKVDYAVALKEGPYLQRLLDFAYEILIRDRPRPFDPSNFEKSSFIPDTSKSWDEETYELLVHLYYLSLKHLPSLCRSWWRDTTLRQTATAVENWTEKYVRFVLPFMRRFFTD